MRLGGGFEMGPLEAGDIEEGTLGGRGHWRWDPWRWGTLEMGPVKGWHPMDGRGFSQHFPLDFLRVFPYNEGKEE